MSEDPFKSAANSLKTAAKVAMDAGLALATAGGSAGLKVAVKVGQKTANVLNALGSLKPKEEEKKDKTWLWVLIGIVIFFTLPILVIGSIGGAFVQLTGLTPITVVPGTSPQITPAPLLCNQTRHQAEKIICWLKEGVAQEPVVCPKPFDRVCTDPHEAVPGCVKEYGVISNCLNAPKSIITNKIAVDAEFENSIVASLAVIDQYSGKLQCVGFVNAVERSLGHSIEGCGNAKDYWGTNCPQDYEKITITSATELKPGDLAVRTTSIYGHIGIIIETEGNIKIVVAQAWGTTGEVFLSDDAITNYQGFLRYKF